MNGKKILQRVRRLLRFMPDRAYIQLVLLTGLVMSVAAVALVARTVAKVAGTTAALVGSIVALTGALGAWSNGMEGPAVMLSFAIVLTLLNEYLRDFEQYRMIIFSLLLIAMMLLRPQGLLPATLFEKKGRSA